MNKMCQCLLINKNCGVCKNGYHIFCNKIPHGTMEEEYSYFIKNPDVAKHITIRDEIGKEILERALAEINAKQHKSTI